ncbi:DEAD/DEAH box helicase [Undibacterium sp.]|uniref:DEAD/DEAH box helicase n=1 Tax=Undibacterium sp. TaxID=1914977 RepID=UPI0027322BE2|nr:DEAD/DEAH box helicase [Undibacterium sp.]MDP1978337.1 DEAD/DEAH box helicase [Undibacterium sp.]
MSSFVTDLANRLVKYPEYWTAFQALQCKGAGSTLPNKLKYKHVELSIDQHFMLLYCASVFAQTNSDIFKTMAQSIALNSFLISKEKSIHERCTRIMTELGNFPGLAYIEKDYDSSNDTLLGILQRRLSQELNTVSIGGLRLPLTDYQKSIWEALPDTKSLAISAPTSAGKSFLVIEHMCRSVEFAAKFSTVYVAPTRALLAEILQTIKARMENVAGVRVSAIPSLDSEKNPKQIFVLTQERLQVLIAISNAPFDLVIIDEAQNLSDGSRGMILQECIDQLIQRGKNTRIVMLSPGAEGFEEAAESVGIDNLTYATTTVSPVLQNRILVNESENKNGLTLQLLTSKGIQPIGQISSDRDFNITGSRLAKVALELGSQGGSLVYATGPSDSEKVASQISAEYKIQKNNALEELATFIEKHIHNEYNLASMIRNGVAFHYGKMPNLLREAIEAAFKSGAIRFLTCTTTLFQGVNLPARNVFIGTPTRGKGTILEPALLWNFAGRAGRMRKDIVGNVFLVDYDQWPQQSMNNLVKFKILPAFKQTILDSYDEVIRALNGDMPKLARNNDRPSRIRSATGLLIARAARGDISEFVTRVVPKISKERLANVTKTAIDASKAINLPAELLSSNWTIDPFGQKRLYEKLVLIVKEGNLDLIIPINPHDVRAYDVYSNIFNLVSKEIIGYSEKYGNYVAVYALPWMRGLPYPLIVKKALDYERKKINSLSEESGERETHVRPIQINVNKVIRSVFDVIEDIIRYQFVQFGKMYIDILTLVLRTESKGEMTSKIFDFSLALELGVATESSKSYVELGLSRIAATALDQLYPDSKLDVPSAKKFLKTVDINAAGLNQIIIDELKRLNLVTLIEVDE